MQDPDPKCRHFVISWHFMAFWHVCQKANCITKSTFSAFSRLFPPFRLFHRIRVLDFSALIGNHLTITLYKEYNMTPTMPRWRRTMARRRENACRKNFLRSNGDSRTTKWNGSGWVRLSFLFRAICSSLDLGFAWYQGLSSLPWCFVIEVTMPEKCNDK